MNDNGATLAELLVAAAVGSIVLLGAGTFYMTSLRFSDAGTSQSFLQRQGTMILDEMRRQIIPAGQLIPGTPPLTRGVCNANPDSIGATNKDSNGHTWTYCFYWDSGAVTIKEIRTDTTAGTSGTLDLLSGLPVALRATSFTTSIVNDQRVTVAFQLTDSSTTGRPWRKNFMTFTTDLTRRN